MKKKIYLTENQFRKIFNININEAFGKGGANTASIRNEKPQFDGCRGKTYGQIWNEREANAGNSMFYPNQQDCEKFTTAKTTFENEKDYENFRNYVNAGKTLAKDWMGIVNASISKLKNGKTSGFFEPSDKHGKYDDYCGMVCRFALLPDLLEMIYFYDDFQKEKETTKTMMSLATLFMRENVKFKELLPSLWGTFAPVLKNINTGGEPQHIPTQKEIEALPRGEEENVDNLDDIEIDFDL